MSGDHFNENKLVYIQATVQGISTTPALPPNNTPDDRSQHVQVTADATGSFKGVTISPKGFQQMLFENNQTAYVWSGETIAVVAANANVGNYSPGPGVSNVAKVTAPAKV